jgi:acyl-CoA dehydrogenase-like protein
LTECFLVGLTLCLGLILLGIPVGPAIAISVIAGLVNAIPFLGTLHRLGDLSRLCLDRGKHKAAHSGIKPEQSAALCADSGRDHSCFGRRFIPTLCSRLDGDGLGPGALKPAYVPTVVVDDHVTDRDEAPRNGWRAVRAHDPVFVPSHRVLPLGRIFSGKVPGLEVQGNHQARFAFPTFGPTALVSPIVGMAQGALDAFAETARGARRMARPGVFEKVAESTLIQSLVGQAAARIDAARTLMLTSLQEGQEVVRAGGTLEIEQRVRIRRNHGFAARTSTEVVNDIFSKSGASAADEHNRVQRFWRDANAAALHPSIDWDTLSALYGMQQLGLQPQGIF